MAPKRRVPSSSLRKSNHSNQPSQPVKFGIQHFFERHSQSAASPSPSSTPSNPNPNPSPIPAVLPKPNPASTQVPPRTADAPAPATADTTAASDALSEVSPEASKQATLKRFKFSPGMLLKQSQDDGGEVVTWKISPVNERLRSLASKRVPGMTRVFSETSRPNGSTIHPCSQKNSSSSSLAGKLKRCQSSPSAAVPSKQPAFSAHASTHGSEACDGGLDNHDGAEDLRSPFKTPPSMSYGLVQQLNGTIASNGDSDHLHLQHHRKALLDLLDQVEDAISEELEPDDPRHCYEHATVADRTQSEPSHAEKIPLNSSYGRPSQAQPCDTFLVLEVLEKHRAHDSSCGHYPVKVLRLLSEGSGKEQVLHLHDEWFYSLIGPGDTVNVIGEFNEEGKCVVDRNKNLLIVHPDILLSGTRVASSFVCPRRAVLDERLKSTEYSISALIGTLLHQIFQAGLLKGLPSRQFLEERAREVLLKNMEGLYACGASQKDTLSTLIEAIPRILNWLMRFTKDSASPTINFGHSEGLKNVRVAEVIDIEEMAWAPRYGLKGMIDASVTIKISSINGGSIERIMPLEFKTGKATSGHSSMEHAAQLILYTVLMSERYLRNDIDLGLLYYLHTDQTLGIKVQRSDLVGLIMRRNELAAEILKASTTQHLPPMLQSSTLCSSCRHLSFCTVYHKVHGGNNASSGLGDVFDNHVNHLTAAHCSFLKHWDRLIDLEAKVSQAAKKELLRPHSLHGENSTSSLLSVVLDIRNELSVDKSGKTDRYIYHFVRQKLQLKAEDDSSDPQVYDLDCSLRCGDCVVISTESGRFAVANGVIKDIGRLHVTVSLPRPLRLPGSISSIAREDLTQEVWRIDKDENASSYATMRFNLIQLFAQNSRCSHLRRLIVDLEAPRFDSAGLFSQDPALSYIRVEKNLNDDQRRSIHKILTAKDYALILGMPGTGKTHAMVHAVKALLMRGASILLTSYTNSAIDNLLIKLKAQGIDFIRIGRPDAVHCDVRSHCFSAMEMQSVDFIKQRMEHVLVVGVTSLGINHPLLANKKFDVCIMDEAGQITLPVSLGPLMLSSKFVLVGDHYQLPPLVQSVEARENGMGISLFWRLSEAHPHAISALQCQYRMCSGIMELSNSLVYGNRLRCGSPEIANAKLKISIKEPIESWLKEILDPGRPAIIVNTDQLPAPESKDHKTVNNPTEACIVSKITVELLKRGIVEGEIGIITPYNSQACLIRRHIGASVEVHTIDKYQGRDKECVLVSFVRSSRSSRAFTSSLLGDWHRINVVLTRAKKKLIMVGSCKTLSRVPLLKLLIEKVDENGGIVHLTNNDACYYRHGKYFSDQRTVIPIH